LNLKKLLPLYIGAAIGPLGGFGIITLIPVFVQGWAVEFGTASLSITFYMAPFIIILIFSGAIAQVFDVRKTLLFGFAVYGLGAAMCGLSPNLWTLLAGRIVQGIGAGFLTPVIMALIGELVPERHVGKAMGILGLAYTVGVTLGPLISGLIEVRYGWSWFFYFLSAIALGAGILYAVSRDTKQPGKGDQFGLLEILRVLKQALLQPGVLYLSFAAFSFFIAYIGILTFTADHMKTGLDLPSDQIGTILSGTGFSGIIASPIAGFLGDHLGRKKVFFGGCSIAILSVAMMAVGSNAFAFYLICFLVLGTGAATAWTSLNTMAVERSPSLRQPVTSVYNAIKFSGYALSPVILSFLYGPFRIRAVQLACICTIVIACLLASKPEI
jgi:ACDE family multidrug resistance protein